jgi:hypothetical protein
MDLVCRLANRQGEVRAWLAEQRLRLEDRAAAADARHSELRSRLEQLEGNVDHLARDVVPRRQAQRSQRVAVLRQQVSILRGEERPISKGAGADRLATALMFTGSLLLVWLVLWQLAPALGFG